MKRKHAILLIFLSVVLVGSAWQMFRPTSLDFSKDEEPFRSMVMPPREVLADSYMDGGSVVLRVTDGDGKLHQITFPVDLTRVRNPHPTAFNGDINDPTLIPLKDPARAKAIAVQLLKSYAKRRTHPSVDIYDLNEIPLRSLSNGPRVMVSRAFHKIAEPFR